jgi:hypothetical protein
VRFNGLLTGLLKGLFYSVESGLLLPWRGVTNRWLESMCLFNRTFGAQIHLAIGQENTRQAYPAHRGNALVRSNRPATLRSRIS